MSLPSRYFQPTLYASSLLLVSGIPGAHAIHRSIGALDPVIKEVVDTCFALPDLTYDGKIIGYAAGKCPSLINCIMDNLHGADQAGLSAGTSIACLLPTILALVGELNPLSKTCGSITEHNCCAAACSLLLA